MDEPIQPLPSIYLKSNFIDKHWLIILSKTTKAIDLLKFLIIQTGYTHFEYIERLATIYRKIHAEALEYQLLSSVLASAEIIGLPVGLIKNWNGGSIN